MAPLPYAALIRGSIPASFAWPLKFCTGTTLVAWVLSVITGNVSQVDRVWTFLPTIYTAYFALLPLWPQEPPLLFWPYTPETVHPLVGQRYSPRALLMLGLTFLWTCRLSYNTWRRGLFNLHDEDYRWQIVRGKIPNWLFHIFNFVFIAVIQNIILLLLGIPAHIAAFQQPAHLSTSDYVLGALAVADLVMEFVADNQQYSFQTYKHTGGFVTRGLWAWSRHPNFFCEQTFWVIITLFPLLAPETPNLSLTPTSMTPLWPLMPALVLCSLFVSSTRFTESISLSKYPEAYTAYQSRVSMFVPFLTPVWGLVLQLRGKKAQVDEMLFGQGPAKGGKDD
ncbi:DUF1295-domain-containing protein [Fomitopsis serialis]|uniref:DUF1295-domain-containing protein n=1 Tax=Fomitopsis serialis TaxID=139415 RepID=UPI002007403C|nr:DUF1295-domain-containing protein [Neoantrodia serialis]KAH9930135.1 DUF1295-domain-containing protein [Neoantrodia serialis]